jgi:hypothetical protein
MFIAEAQTYLLFLISGKFLYVITGSHYDFASHVASFAIGEDWKDLFDIVIFFARKPSFFVEKRPFWRLNGPVEVIRKIKIIQLSKFSLYVVLNY